MDRTDKEIATEIERVAADLVDVPREQGGISQIEHEVWRLKRGLDVLRDADGNPELGFAMCRKYGVCDRTLRRYASAAHAAIVRRVEQIKSGTVRWGHSVASGSDVRWAKDGTPTGDTGGSSWDPERLRAVLAGTTRKQGKLPPKGKRKERPAA